MSNGFLYTLTVAIWGSTWLAIEFQLGVVAPDVSVFYRHALAATVMIGWCLARGMSLKFPKSAHWRFMAMGLTMFCLNYLLAYYAQVHITSALAAIAFSAMLWMNMIYARWFFGIRSGMRAVAGSALGIAGVIVIFYPQMGSFTLDDATLFGFLLALGGAMLASLGNMVSQEAQLRGLPIVQSNAWGMSYGALFTGLIVLGGDSQFTFDGSASYVLSLLYLTVFGTIVAFGAYLTLLGRIGAHKVGYAVVLFPVVAVMLSVLFEGLPLTASLVIGVIMVLGGNFFVVQSRSPSAALNHGATKDDNASIVAVSDSRRAAISAPGVSDEDP